MSGGQVRAIELPDGTEIFARVSRLPAEPGSGDNDWEDVGLWDTLTGKVDGLKDIVTGVAASVKHAAEQAAPDEWSVTFGIEVSARPGRAVALLADGEATGQLSLTLTWIRDQRPAAV